MIDTTKKQSTDLIKLQAAHVTQLKNGGVKSTWQVKENITEELLQELPNYIKDMDVFLIMDFAKKYELIAFNKGIKFQKDKQNSVLVDKNNHLENTLKEVLAENERLATILEQHIKRIGA